MLAPAVRLRVRWLAAAPPEGPLRDRLEKELHGLAWALSQLEALADEASRLTGAEHPWLLPRIEARLPLYDLERRYRIVVAHVEGSRIRLLDEQGREAAQVQLA